MDAVSDTLAPSYHSAGAVAEAAVDRKRRKYLQISESHHFIPIAVETLGPICEESASFISAIAEKISRTTGGWPAWEDLSLSENFRGNTAWQCSRLPRNHDFFFSEYASHLRSRPMIFYLYFWFDFIFLYFNFYLIFAYRKLSTVGYNI